MDDEISHMGVVHGLLRLLPPRFLGAGEIGKDADDIELVDIAEIDTIQAFQLATEDEMEQLFRFVALGMIGQGKLLRLIGSCSHPAVRTRL